MSKEFPENWESLNLKDICFFQEGPGLRNWQYREKGTKFINIRCIKDGYLDTSIAQFLSSEEVENKYKHFLLNEGDYVLSSSATIGRIAIVRKYDLPLLLNTSVIRFRTLNKAKLDMKYLFHFLQSQQFFEKISEQSQGSAQVNFGPSHLKLLNAFFPPLTEQKKIAKILTGLTTLINFYELKINKLKNVKKSTLNLLLKVSKLCSEEKLKTVKLNSIAKDFIVPMRDKPKEFSGNIPWIRIEDFEGKFIRESKSGKCVSNKTVSKMNLKIYPLNTVLCTCSATLGICAIVKKPLVSNQTFIGIVPDQDKISPSFLYYLLESKAKDLQKLSTGTTIAYLPRNKFESLEVTIPPENKQKRIVEILDGIEENIKSLEEKIRKTKFILKGLQKNLLSGEKIVNV